MTQRFTVAAAVDGKLDLSDLRMDPAALAHQAVVAEENGNPQLAENFLRAAELATIDDEEVMGLYEALRPHRSTAAELDALQASLEIVVPCDVRNWCARPPRCMRAGACCGDLD